MEVGFGHRRDVENLEGSVHYARVRALALFFHVGTRCASPGFRCRRSVATVCTDLPITDHV